MGESSSAFWQNLLSTIQGGAQTYGPRVASVVLVFTVFFLIAQLFKLYGTRAVDVNLYRKPTPKAVAAYNKTRRKIFIGRFMWLVFLILAGVLALAASGIDIIKVLEGLGFVGLALAWTLSELVQHYVAGFIILTQKHFNIGEQVEVNGKSGVIKAIESRYTVLVDFQEHEVMVPNMAIAQSAIVISSVEGLQRDIIRVRVDNHVDFREVLKIGERSIAATPGVERSVAPRGYVRYFGDSTLLAFYYSGTASRREHFILRSEAMIRLKEAFDKAGIKISYPSGVEYEESKED
ncbi:MAG: mechanosensitive ion channel family protein [bacterium]|nr:mechanosensitive ion channel family protein [bacterium]